MARNARSKARRHGRSLTVIAALVIGGALTAGLLGSSSATATCKTTGYGSTCPPKTTTSTTTTCTNTGYGMKCPTPVTQASCVVPKLIGDTTGKAKTALKNAHCTLGTVHRAHNHHKAGQIYAQSPKAGTKLANGAAVKVSVSKGP